MKTESYTSAAGYEKEAPDMRAQFEADIRAEYGTTMADSFFDRFENGDYIHYTARFAFLGYQLAKGVK